MYQNKHFRLYLLQLSVIVLFAAIFAVFLPKQALAVNGCAGATNPGGGAGTYAGLDSSKCYRIGSGGIPEGTGANVDTSKFDTNGNAISNAANAQAERDRQEAIQKQNAVDSSKAPAVANPPVNSNAPAQVGSRGGSATAAPGDPAANDEGTTCAVEMIGWILCPVIQGVATMSDKIFDLLAGNFLQIEPELTKADSGIKVPWDAARNIANVLFIVAFIIIIYSQITGAGISNYGIKKMLPRLIMAALFVNISFWICQGMVDLSNILGFNIYTFLKAQAAAIGPSAMADIPGADTVTGGGWLSVLAVAILAAVGIAWLLLAPLGAIALMVLITCVTIVIILLLRKAIIILLVVISPIAFVAYLLPNTEKFFNKWLSMFWQLLMVFPVVALLMGGGQLASTIIMSAGATKDAKTQCSAEDAGKVTSIGAQSDGYNVSCEGSIPVGPDGDRHVGWMLGLVAAGVAVAPLLAVWAVLKGALAAAGAIGGKIANSVQKGTATGGNKFGGALGKTSVGRGLAARKAIKQNYKDQRFAGKMSQTGRKGRFTRISARGVGGNLGLGAGKLADKMSDDGKIGALKKGLNMSTGSLQAQSTKLSANFAGAAAKIEEQDVKDQQDLISSQLRSRREETDSAGNRIEDQVKLGEILKNAIISGDKAGAKAATNMLVGLGNPGKKELRSVMGGAGGMNTATASEFRANIAQNHSSLKSTDADIYAAAGDTQNQGLSHHQSSMDTYEGLTNDQLATQSGDSLNNSGATRAIAKDVEIVDEQGTRHTVTRGTAVLASKAGAEIKDSNRSKFV
ncbi:MAG: hypothetical protein EOO17_04950 [Chloroflexi bacterium]|nr:MAG: hypothetical protein EOO17_04950 [Chloroflexota bacterium]